MNKINNIMINNKTNRENKYNDNEINLLSYKKAIKIDKRTYIEYYFSLLRTKQLLLFTFYTNTDYNSRQIKICLFFFSFALFYTVNTLFFDDSTIHKIYEDEGKYNFIYQIPKILYSTLISTIINIISKNLSISEKNIINIRKNKDVNNNMIIKLKKCLKIKFILFFIFTFLLLPLFWYYVSIFCIIYRNSQFHVLKDTLISFGLSLSYPIGLCLLPGIFRIPSLKASKKNKKCLYKLSQFIQNVL